MEFINNYFTVLVLAGFVTMIWVIFRIRGQLDEIAGQLDTLRNRFGYFGSDRKFDQDMSSINSSLHNIREQLASRS